MSFLDETIVKRHEKVSSIHYDKWLLIIPVPVDTGHWGTLCIPVILTALNRARSQQELPKRSRIRGTNFSFIVNVCQDLYFHGMISTEKIMTEYKNA